MSCPYRLRKYPKRTHAVMNKSNDRTASFVVRVWLERREIAGKAPFWRGVVEHVTTGTQRSVEDLDSIVVFMAEYMLLFGVDAKTSLLLKVRIRWWNLRNLLRQRYITLRRQIRRK